MLILIIFLSERVEFIFHFFIFLEEKRLDFESEWWISWITFDSSIIWLILICCFDIVSLNSDSFSFSAFLHSLSILRSASARLLASSDDTNCIDRVWDVSWRALKLDRSDWCLEIILYFLEYYRQLWKPNWKHLERFLEIFVKILKLLITVFEK